MKCVKKLVAVLLTAVMALTLLTACGGGGSGSSIDIAEEQKLTNAINRNLSNWGGTTVTYNNRLDYQLATLMEHILNEDIDYDNEAEVEAAFEEAGIDKNSYGAIYTTSVVTMESAAGVLANKIMTKNNSLHKTAKEIGYYPFYDPYTGEGAVFALLKY